MTEHQVHLHAGEIEVTVDGHPCWSERLEDIPVLRRQVQRALWLPAVDRCKILSEIEDVENRYRHQKPVIEAVQGERGPGCLSAVCWLWVLMFWPVAAMGGVAWWCWNY